MNIQYNFRLGPETVWFVALSVLTPVLQAAIGFTGVADITPNFLDGLLAACVRALGGAILAVITGGGFQVPGEPGPDPAPRP